MSARRAMAKRATAGKRFRCFHHLALKIRRLGHYIYFTKILTRKILNRKDLLRIEKIRG